MGARPLRRMTFGNKVITGGSHAPEPSYARPRPGPSRGRRSPASPSPVPGLQAQDLGRVLWSLLLAAAARITSLSDACGRLRDAPSDETARRALLATLPDYAALQRRLNAALAGHLPKALRKRRQRLAIDLTLIPYHGREFRDPE